MASSTVSRGSELVDKEYPCISCRDLGDSFTGP